MSKIRVNEITDLNDNLLWDATQGVGGATVTTSTGTQTVVEALDQRAISVETLADLKALDTSDLSGGEGFRITTTGRSGPFTALVGDYSDEVSNDPLEGIWVAFGGGDGSDGAFKRSDVKYITPEMFEDSGGDDTVTLAAWFSYDHPRKRARGDYTITPTGDAFLFTAGSDKNVEIDMVGSSIDAGTQCNNLFNVDVPAGESLDTLRVRMGTVISNDNVNRCLVVSGDGHCKKARISDLLVTDLKENGQEASCHGIRFSLTCDDTKVFRNHITGLQKTSSIPGAVACQAIRVDNIQGSCEIFGNSVDKVLTNDSLDADGIATAVSGITDSTPPSTLLKSKVRVHHNQIKDCAVRFVKSQGHANVHDNNLVSQNVNLEDNFVAIDGQFADLKCRENEWRIYDGVTSGSDVRFFNANARAAYENISDISGNKLSVGANATLRFFGICTLTENLSHISVGGNTVEGTGIEHFVRVNAPDDAADLDYSTIVVNGNGYVAGSGSRSIVQLVGSEWENSAMNSRVSLLIFDNNPKSPSVQLEALLAISLSPYVGKIRLSGNGTPLDNDYSRVDAQGLDIENVMDGSCFYYATDGGSGGLLGTIPSNYDRFVVVYKDGNITRLTNTIGSYVERLNTGDWYEYTGTAV